MSFHLYADDAQLYASFGCNDDTEVSSVTLKIEKLESGKTEMKLISCRMCRMQQHVS